jgi:hypothetical protein
MIDVEGRLETGGLSAFGGHALVPVATTVRTASSGAPWRPRGANPPRPGRGPNGARFSAVRRACV